MWVRNVQLASFSIAIGTLQLIGRAVLAGDAKAFLHGFTWRVWIMVLNGAVGGRDANSGGAGGPPGPLGLAIPYDSYPCLVEFASDLMEVTYRWTPG